MCNRGGAMLVYAEQRMHGLSVCRNAGMWKVSRKWERCLLGVWI